MSPSKLAPPSYGPWDVTRWEKPDNVVQWITSPDGLNRTLYPVQATLMKIWALQKEHFTMFDWDVIADLTECYARTSDETGEGVRGLQIDVIERMDICKAEGRPWFRETVAAIGRRGGKGYLGALKTAVVTWTYMGFLDPHAEFGLDRDKKFQFMVFGSKKEHAQKNQWRDINAVLTGAPCFSPYISRALEATLTVMAPNDFHRSLDRYQRSVHTDQDIATFEFIPKESTLLAGRGPAVFGISFDEFAHIVREVAKVDSTELWDASTPALDQFGLYAFIYQPSTTWTRTGRFLENYLRSIERIDNKPAYPELFMSILESWDPYMYWDRAHEIEMWPGGPKFPNFKQPVIAYDEQMRRLERANPQQFAVERRSRWATVLDAYLDRELVQRLFDPYGGQQLFMIDRGALGMLYRLHFDSSAVNDRFAFAIAHRTPPDDRGLPHVIFDYIEFFDPKDFPNHEIDFDAVMGKIKDKIDAFIPTDVTFDQFYSRVLKNELEQHVAGKSYPRQVSIWERTAKAELNWQTWEAFKTALHLRIVHAPRVEELEQELSFLVRKNKKVEAPTSGPVQTDDIATTVAIITHDLLEDVLAGYLGEALSGFTAENVKVASLTGGGDDEFDVHDQLSDFGRGSAGGSFGRPHR